MKREHNIAYIDGQNLHLGTTSTRWSVDFTKFRVYLRDKFHVDEAYYYLGFVTEEEEELYNSLQKAWFIVVFREHSSALKWKKKGNVDVDIVFDIMKTLANRDDLDKIVLVSWDGDYIKLVRYLIANNKLKKILFPNNKYSSLYKKIKYTFGINLSLKDVKKKIAHKKKRTS